MKNIHVLPTDKPSRLHLDDKLFLSTNYQLSKGINSIVKGRNIYITSDEEIKEGDWFLCLDNGKCNDSIYKANEAWLNMEEKQPSYCKKIILTTDQDLIKDGVQAIDDEFLEWFVKNPSCEEVEVVKTAPIRPFGSLYKIIIPKEEAKKKHIVMLVGDKVNEEQEVIFSVYLKNINNK
jgi:putative transposon-encoded protein